MSKSNSISLFEQIHRESGLTRNQVQLWIGQIFNPQSPHYNMAFAFELRGFIDISALQDAWQTVVDRNAILRLSLIEKDGRPEISHHPQGSCPTQVIDFRGRSDPKADFQKWSHARCSRALSLSGPLVDSVLVRLSDNETGWYLNQHHIITDAGSTVLLYRQVMQTYRSLVCPGDESAPEGLVPYYEAYQTLMEPSGEVAKTALSFWQERQRPKYPRVPFWGRKDSIETTASDRLTLHLTQEQSEALRAISGTAPFRSFFPELSQFALFATLLTAWLHVASGRKEIRFDAPVQNRNSPESRKALGLFIEMYPFGVTLDSEESFWSLGEKCLAEAQNFIKHAHTGTGFDDTIKASSAVLNFFPAAFDTVEGIEISSDWIHSGHSDTVHGFRLQVHDYDNTGRFTLLLDFNKQAFSSCEQERGRDFLRVLIDNFIDDLNQQIGAIGILQPDELRHQIEDFNSAEFPVSGKTVMDHFLHQVNTDPDGVAVKDRGLLLTYAQLHERVCALASRIGNSAADPDPPVAIYMRRSLDAVVGILATMGSGRAFVPIDPGYPASRVRYILEDCGASLVLSHLGLADSLADPGRIVFEVDKLSNEPAGSDLVIPGLNHRAYMIYTSGSTGRPKGVPVRHLGLSEYLEWANRKYVRGETLSFPLFTSLSFDLTITSLFLPLISGGTLVVYEELEGPLDSSLIDVINDNAVDVVKLTPSHLSLLQQLDLSTSRIKRLILGGEDLKVHLARTISGQFAGPVEIYNEYGPTEAVVGCMIHLYDVDQDLDSSVPIGVPADNVQLYVLNEHLNPLPTGVPGELCISRTGLSEGYHNQPELTSERFIRNPFRDDQRLYRTGDLVRFNDRGLLEYLGRIDRQLKLSGFRIEPGEIEAAVVSHPAIKECVVTTYLPEGQARSTESVTYCQTCGLPSNYPKISFDKAGVCSVCRAYESIKDHAQEYFKTMRELEVLFEENRARVEGNYDALVLLSGGKDSTYVLCRLVDMGLRVHAFTLDNGYISDQAKQNIRRVVENLGVDHEFATTPEIQTIFKDSLMRFSNVCNGCFKTIYTLAVNKARELGIPAIITGLSRGQFFETRLTENLFKAGRFSPEEIDRAVFEARKLYHRTDDAVTRLLDTDLFQDDRIFEEIQFVDFYRYCDVSMSEMMAYLKERVAWVRPSDTGRSTNCLVNDVGIYIHNKERGFHNYALPYSWDVRMGHKTREEAMHELQDELDMDSVHRMLEEIDYDEDRLVRQASQRRMVAYYVPSGQVREEDLRRYLTERLPEELMPHALVALKSIPLTPNGKVDMDVLPRPDPGGNSRSEKFITPSGPLETAIAGIWTEVLGVDSIGATDGFFHVGGTSLAAMEVMLRICNQFEVDLPLQSIFQSDTVAGLAQLTEARIMEEISELSDQEAEDLTKESPG